MLLRLMVLHSTGELAVLLPLVRHDSLLLLLTKFGWLMRQRLVTHAVASRLATNLRIRPVVAHTVIIISHIARLLVVLLNQSCLITTVHYLIVVVLAVAHKCCVLRIRIVELCHL